MKNIQDMVDDALMILRKAKEDHPDKKLFLFGHSMGGLVAILSTIREPKLFDGAIYSSPA